MDNTVLDKREKMPRKQLLELIHSGQFQIILPSGSVITDFKAIEAKFGMAVGYGGSPCYAPPIERKEGFAVQVIKHPAPVVESRSSMDFAKPKRTHRRRDGTPPKNTIFESPNGPFTIHQLEHIGDAIAEVAIRILSHQTYGTSKISYGLFVCALATNENFSTCPGIKSGDHFEIVIGQEFATDGLEPAFEKALEMIKQTKAYKDAVENP